jgi:copper chaperone NosL
MRTTAMPGGGALAIGLALGLGIAAWRGSRTGKGKSAVGAAATLAALLLVGCGGGPREIHYRQDACARCRMILMDARYGAELVTRRGKALVFDSIECLAAHTLEQPADAEGARGLYVTPYDAPNTLVPAEAAGYLYCEQLPSPMGQGLSAAADRAGAEALLAVHGGRVLAWSEVLAQVRQAWKLP